MAILRILFIAAVAFAIGRLSVSETVRTVTVPGPIQFIQPIANRGVELTPGIRWVNLDAQVPIMQVDSEAMLKNLAGFSGDGFILGAYTPESPAIYVLGTWSMECETSIHEYTHMLEHMMPDQAWRIRRIFHLLCSNKFRIDSMDLIPELPEPANQ